MGKKGLRVVIDTNFVLSALVFGGKVASLRYAWQTGALIPLISKVTATELIRVLAYPKFNLTAVEQEDLLRDYLPYSQTVTMPYQLPTIPNCRDTFDEPFLLLAKVSKADYLVTGDKDLLSLKEDFCCPIITRDYLFNLLEKV
ncbi:putative toxin-antitoxin system toxin component, PIN family [Cyanobacterium sp. IPPAS B-1200]|uniref:putative toxin-antitoxin system toxin component, PIN family n=1 Tax=Cyanobacterium sp. IPPAS B-1200 TaxID=1562720 RepID=UPI00085254DF|nr:putative toxin-antitoxin system toxin component, PIN family [Cyanobacterium sp. IPPAS B-1200]OEJ78585.1 twitching motility protein PilT [Cyanobacterium sp. IPPAS B-1200]